MNSPSTSKGFPIPGTSLQALKSLPLGKHTFDVVTNGTTAILTMPSDPHTTIVVTGVSPADLSISGVLSGISDGLLAALGALKKVLGCTPKTTTTVNVGTDGKVTSVVTETSCIS